MTASWIHTLIGRFVRISMIVSIASMVITTQVSAGQPKALAAGSSKVFLPAAVRPPAEWSLHKTADGQHPDGNEQQMVWLMNRARTNPTQEGIWLATSPISDIAFPRSYFKVSLSVLQSEFAGYSAMPPAAFDSRLYEAAKAHSEYLIETDSQGHTGQFDRVRATGYVFTHIRGNVFSYADSALNAHAGFNIDWGGSATDGDASDDGMQFGRGHRKAIMSLDDNYYSNVGIAVVPVTDPFKNVGPLVTTGNYAHPSLSAANEYDRFIIGTVWQDSNSNGMYDPGEGYGGVTVTVENASYYAVTASGGGYAIPILVPGTYRVRFSGVVAGEKQIVIGPTSVLADFQVPAGSSAPAEKSPSLAPSTGTLIAPPPAVSE